MSAALRQMGAHILTYPSAFSTETGRAHWEPLLRARAIESQCYVVAAAQAGRHCDTRTSYGRSMVVDPWGTILVESPAYSEGYVELGTVISCRVERDVLEKVRAFMPIQQHRRSDVYTIQLAPDKLYIPHTHMMFSDKVINADTIFCRTRLCFAFTNIRCVVPGRILCTVLREGACVTMSACVNYAFS